MRISDWSSDVCSSDLEGLGCRLIVFGCAGGCTPSGSLGFCVCWDHGCGCHARVIPKPYATRCSVSICSSQSSSEPSAMPRSEEHTSELQSLMRISYAVFCLKKKKKT